MYVSATNILKSVFSSGYQKKGKKPVAPPADEDHTYIRGDIENRGPCPGLNALANQGYL